MRPREAGGQDAILAANSTTADAAHGDVDTEGTWTSPIGQRSQRREDRALLQGQARFLDDIEPPRTAHVAFVRSPWAHATLGAIGTSDAERAFGVLEVVTAASLDGSLLSLPIPEVRGHRLSVDAAHPILARGQVRYVGQPVVAVVAETRALAEDACELVDVAYTPLDAIVSIEQALTSTDRVHDSIASNVYLRVTKGRGNVDAAFARADATVSQRFEIPRLVAAPMETRGALAEALNGHLTIWCSSQDVHRPLADLCHILQREATTIRLLIPSVGGAFGSKGGLAPEAALVAWAALRHDRPVKWTEDRLENFVAAYQGRGLLAEVDLAVTAAGRILALRASLHADFGAYLLPDTPHAPFITARLLTGVYAIDAATVEIVGTATHKVPSGPYRGAGRPEAALMLERMVDIVARQLGLDPIDVRRRNFIPRDAFPYPSPLGTVTEPGDYSRCLDALLERLDVDHWRELQQRGDRLIGVGIAVFLEDCGGGSEGAAVSVDRDGTVRVRISVSPHGQGHETAFAQIVADRLRVEPDDIVVSWGDSTVAPPGDGTYGSRSIALAGSAALLAADELRDKLATTEQGEGGEGFERSREAIVAFGGDVFSTGAYGCVVEIDERTGVLTVLKLVAVDDAGRLVNPLLAEGQVLGAAVQGFGEALLEHAQYDADGQPITVTFADYSLPTAADVPLIESIFVETPSVVTPLGARGIGEAGTLGVPAAIGNAVADALARIGGYHVDAPYTPEVVWGALHGGARSARDGL